MTKADVIDILVDLQSEIEETVLADDPNTLLTFLQARESCVAVIQQKIYKLKEEETAWMPLPAKYDPQKSEEA